MLRPSPSGRQDAPHSQPAYWREVAAYLTRGAAFVIDDFGDLVRVRYCHGIADAWRTRD